MSSLEEVTNQLMKSAKELADWEYPLSEILEKYYALLEDPTEINFGEAALVVQNSVDVFTKRVDCLGKEVSNLSESFLHHEAEEEKAKLKNKERRTRKIGIDFDNFELLDFRKEVGKNLNLKPSSMKPVKLLNRRFPQLEIAVSNLLKPVEVADVHEEIIGKKYDFRCNQQLTFNGMLVDECMPTDFDEPNSRTSNQAILTSPIRTICEDITSEENHFRTDTGTFVMEDSVNEENNSTVENSTVLENRTVEENRTIVENSLENSTIVEDSTIRENSTLVKNSTMLESSTADENSTIIDNTTLVENSTNVENSSNVENSTIVEDSTIVENTTTITTENISIRNSTTLENSTTENVILNNTAALESITAEENRTAQEDTGYFSLTEAATNSEGVEEMDFQPSAESNLDIDFTDGITDEPDHFDDHLDQDDFIEEDHETSDHNESPSEFLNNFSNSNNDSENLAETVICESNSVENQQKETSDHVRNSLNEVQSSEALSISENLGNTDVSGTQTTPLKSNLKNQGPSACARNLLKELHSPEETNVSDIENISNSNQVNVVESSKNANNVENNQDQEESENGSGNCKETDSGYRSSESEDFEIPRRRSKRMKNMVCVVNDLDKTVWKPIPFDQGIPEKLPKSRSKFKLPCHISLLKSKRTSRKRKIPSEEVKRKESLSQFIMNESESPLKKLNMYSPSRPFMPLKTEELSDFQKSFEDCFKSRQCYDVFHYEAATTITMDLLGFFPSFTKKDPLSNATVFKTLAPTPEHVSASCSDPGFSPRPTSPGIVIFDTVSPPDSPIMAEAFDVEDDEPLNSTLNYQQLIETRMKEIYEEFDVRTDLEQNVARWHQMIQPKLQEEERRPPFNIHEYGDRIVEKLEECTERKMAFENLIVDQSSAEAARYFSAALQLANTNNVDIQTGEQKTDIELILINSTIARNEISCETPKHSKSKNSKKFKRIT